MYARADINHVGTGKGTQACHICCPPWCTPLDLYLRRGDTITLTCVDVNAKSMPQDDGNWWTCLSFELSFLGPQCLLPLLCHFAPPSFCSPLGFSVCAKAQL
jgi:hypothetical protein